ncbi:MAG: flagellin [Rhodobacteraceae bacterium]|nr:flagellin [Paracoccaceae bacterium]
MSSILTNSSAMVALQTLQSINKNLGSTMSEISTGRTVDNAKDNASIWAISQTMQSDVDGFKGISDALATGGASVAVARTAAESITDLLGQIKSKIVAAQDPSADQGKLQTDIAELRNQVGSVVGAAQFNGLNLVDGTNASINVLASLDRDSAGNVTASSINVTGQNLSTGAGAIKAALAGSDGAGGDGATAAIFIDAAGTADIVVVDAALAAGDTFNVKIGSEYVSYVVTAEDVAAATSEEVVANGIRSAINGMDNANITADVAGDTITVTNAAGDTVNMTTEIVSVGTGGLSGLAGINVDDGGGGNSTQALADIEGLIQTSIDAAAAFGSSQARIETQSEFVSKLTDSLKVGIGALVDADMEAASARLQALQVQQQLATQSLSIANQAPQNILSLFR